GCIVGVGWLSLHGWTCSNTSLTHDTFFCCAGCRPCLLEMQERRGRRERRRRRRRRENKKGVGKAYDVHRFRRGERPSCSR
ncbi:unnamed protein product, partial [Discosporangium mesarthrocarpum]